MPEKCPVCGVAHRKYPLACAAEVDNRYTHIVIAGYTCGKTTRGKTTRAETVAKAKKSHLRNEWIDETVRLKEEMDQYLQQFRVCKD